MQALTKKTLQIYAQHAGKYPWLMMGLLLTLLATSAAELLAPLLYKQFFDILSQNEIARDLRVPMLIGVIGWLAMLSVLNWGFRRATALLTRNFQTQVVADLEVTSFKYLMGHSYSFFSDRMSGALARKGSKFAYGFEGIADIIEYNVIPTVTRMVVILVVLSWYSYWMGLVVVAWLVVFLVASYRHAQRKLRHDVEMSRTDTLASGHAADCISNQSNVKIFSSLKAETTRFQQLLAERTLALRKSWRLSEAMDAVGGMFMVTLEIAILYLAVQLWRDGSFTVGDFALIQAYLIQIFDRIWGLGRMILQLNRHFGNAEEMAEIFDTPHGVVDVPKAKSLVVTKGVVEFKGVGFAYNETRTVFNDLNLTIAAGEKVGIVGYSGAGKSSLMSLLFRFHDVSQGSITIDGQNIAHVTQDSLRKMISLVPQDPLLFHRSLKDNIRYARPNATDAEVAKAAKLAHCDEFIEVLPERYEALVGERGVKLSGGERQRVAIARAIIKDAPILVLDEATSSLDSHSESMIQDALQKLMKGRTTLVIAHRLSTIMKMDRIIVMQQGKIVEVGTHHELIERPKGIYAKLWKLQAGGFIP